jgi:hypothetical protein
LFVSNSEVRLKFQAVGLAYRVRLEPLELEAYTAPMRDPSDTRSTRQRLRPARNEHTSTGGDMANPTDTGQHEHQRIELRTRCPDCGQELAHQTFNRADFEQQQMTELPERDAMSLVNANLALPVNLALAANVLSDGSIAGAGATQNTPIDQGMLTQPTP